MKTLYFSLSLLLCGVLFGAASGCVVEFPDELPYTCETDEDCGGKGYVCTSLPDSRRYCCQPSPELCNRLDDDCNGAADDLGSDSCYTGPEETRNVGACRAGKPSCGDGNILCVGEVLPTAESCNGKDDDCDGAVDEDFDFQTGQNNCGRCDQACTSLQECVAGQCQRRAEVVCDNGQDDDADDRIDCADSDCSSLPCGNGCVCRNNTKAEADCANGLDDDEGGTGPIDCADDDCDTRVCGPGCICIDNRKGEGDCTNGVDDDEGGTGPIDCADPDCTEKSCDAVEGCVCRGGIKVEDLCDDGVDNDNDGTTDCQDSDCNNKECGVGCVCEGTARKEAGCFDGLDNDGDSLIDCADPHCNTQSCVFGEAGATCRSSQCAEIRCVDTLDNDKDGKRDCEDSDCVGVTCDKPGGGKGTCQSSGQCT